MIVAWEKKSRELIVALQNYYTIKDIDENKNFLKIFNALYVSEKRLTYDEIARQFFIGVNTLKRYIEKFNLLAILLSEQDNK